MTNLKPYYAMYEAALKRGELANTQFPKQHTDPGLQVARITATDLYTLLKRIEALEACKERRQDPRPFDRYSSMKPGV